MPLTASTALNYKRSLHTVASQFNNCNLGRTQDKTFRGTIIFLFGKGYPPCLDKTFKE